MRKSRELLLKYRFDPRFVFSEVEVWYADRGAPGDLSRAEGDRIGGLTPYYLEVLSETGTTCIPYHRIRRILYAGETVWMQ